MRSMIIALVSFVVPAAAAATENGACEISAASSLSEVSEVVSAAALESGRTFTPGVFSSTTLINNIPEALRLPVGVDLDRMPRHSAMGTDLRALIKGREMGESRIPHPRWWWKTVVTKNYDSNADGVADTFVSMDLFEPTQIASVSVGGPAYSNVPRAIYSGERIWRVEVIGRGVSREIFRADFYQRIAEDGVAITQHDTNRDGATDSIYMGMYPHSNAREGWPYVRYSPN